jgi:peptidoglycan/LPS O-acetylase OafA/YrhL
MNFPDQIFIWKPETCLSGNFQQPMITSKPNFFQFFVISGYLMIMLLSRKKAVTLADSTNFYYRRIKRIVPTYIFVILLTLIACYLLVSEFEFGQVISESIPSMFFYSNLPFVHKTNYFDIVSFLHEINFMLSEKFSGRQIKS